jgi:hypothetical protein
MVCNVGSSNCQATHAIVRDVPQFEFKRTYLVASKTVPHSNRQLR